MKSTASMLAIGVVLLPNDPVFKLATKLNHDLESVKRDLFPRYCGPDMNGEGFFLHITLLQAFIEERSLTQAKVQLKQIVNKTETLQLAIECSYEGDAFNTNICGLAVSMTPELKALHETVMTAFAGFESSSGDIGSLLRTPGEIISPHTLDWIHDYRKKVHSGYKPHITLGIGKKVEVNLPLHFTCGAPVIVQLGNYCTARKIL